jgi:hypothetical protein
MEVNGQLHALAALPPGEIATGIHWIGSCSQIRSRNEIKICRLQRKDITVYNPSQRVLTWKNL